jgi:cation diffusion facilitator family transporter
VPALIGILFTKFFEIWWMDGALGIIVALMLFYATYQIMKETINKLLGEAPSENLINSIKEEIARSYPNNLNLHHFHIHNYASQKELTFHIRLDNNLDIETGHKIASDIEDMINKSFDMTATIHVEPLNK